MPKNLERAEFFVLVCQGSDCKKRGAKEIAKRAKKQLKAKKWFRRSQVLKTRCTGNCKKAPVCGIVPNGRWITRASPEDVEALIDEHIDALSKG